MSDLALVAEKEVPEVSQLKFGELTVHIANHDRLGSRDAIRHRFGEPSRPVAETRKEKGNES